MSYAVKKDGLGFRAVESAVDCTIDEDFFDVLPQPTAAEVLAKCKTEQIAILEQAYQAAIQIPVAYMGATFQADEYSQNVLTKSLVAGSVPAGFYWLDANNVKVPMLYADLQGLAGAMLVQGQAAFDKLQSLKATVNKTTTNTEAKVKAIKW